MICSDVQLYKTVDDQVQVENDDIKSCNVEEMKLGAAIGTFYARELINDDPRMNWELLLNRLMIKQAMKK